MKKIIYVLLIVIICLAFSACSNSEKQMPTDELIDINNGSFEEMPQVEDKDSNQQAAAPDKTVAQTLLEDFETMVNENPELTAFEITESLMQNPVIEFMGATIAVNEGCLTGFGDCEITGFEEGVMLIPNIITIPFISYVFVLDTDTDAETFKQLLSDNADMNWSVYTEAEETMVGNVGNTIFFVMSPRFFES